MTLRSTFRDYKELRPLTLAGVTGAPPWSWLLVCESETIEFVNFIRTDHTWPRIEDQTRTILSPCHVGHPIPRILLVRPRLHQIVQFALDPADWISAWLDHLGKYVNSCKPWKALHALRRWQSNFTHVCTSVYNKHCTSPTGLTFICWSFWLPS